MKELKNFNCSTLVTKNEIPKIAIVCRPNSQKICLDNAEEEAEKIYEILTAENLKDKIEVADPIFEIDFSGFYKILNNNFDLIHFIGHGFAENTKAGFVLNEDEEFTYQDLRKLDKAPRLIFANSCYSSKGSKINLAQRFVQFGTENFVGTLASVSDSESKDFSIKFWEFFSQGNTISRSLFLSRRYFFTQNKNIWAYYTGFGKGKFRLKID
ncbi:CHAT domain-containing protein [bacterium]|nr:CHAT domain-containing protein [bacterium]